MLQPDGFALQHAYKDAVILNGQKKKKKKKKTKPLKCSTGQKHRTGFQLLEDLLIESSPIFLVKSAKMENLSIFIHQPQGQMWVETMQ